MERIQVVLADAHPSVREGIGQAVAAASDLALVGKASTGAEARRLCLDKPPDVLLLGLNLFEPPSPEIVALVREKCPAAKIVILTAHDDLALVRDTVVAGAAGYVLKEEVTQSVLNAIRAVARGNSWFSPAIAAKVVQASVAGSRERARPSLTERQAEVLQLIAIGKSDEEIGEADRTRTQRCPVDLEYGGSTLLRP
ncbi:MAG: response regulator [Ardenticatenaceae bacterium]